jgi:hypothetical protein
LLRVVARAVEGEDAPGRPLQQCVELGQAAGRCAQVILVSRQLERQRADQFVAFLQRVRAVGDEPIGALGQR